MAAVGAAFAEYIVKFVILGIAAVAGVFIGIKLKSSKENKKSEK